jgi:uncharacterized membrane-anchored protein
MSPRLRGACVTLALAIATAASLHAQERTLRDLPWASGPVTGDLGTEATARVPSGCLFVGPDAADDFMVLTQNPPGGDERGVIFCGDSADAWFVVFSFDKSGYVKDDERDELDGDKILRSIRSGTEAGNERRRERGWATLAVEGWVQPPFYDTTTNNLTWSLSLLDSDGDRTVNHSVRLLGRGGVMHADLVADRSQLTTAIPAFNRIVEGYEYKSGHRYAEWRAGDKVAAFGLTALIAGGAGAVAAKTGLLGKLWKLIVAGVVAVGAGIKALFKKKQPAA